ncbi:MAG TPA: hypothetical protein P5048_00620 [Chlamydiales bacterium]|nr:hypothetical protein [Chlamydiales bacterium]
MKKNIFIFLSFLTVSVFANSESYVAQIEGRIIIDKEGYYITDDGSCWTVRPLKKRWRTPLEWWKGVQIAAENFDCKPEDWHSGSSIEIYSKSDFVIYDVENASNKKELKRCTHIFVNTYNDQILFATKLGADFFMSKLVDDASCLAYKQGFSSGYSLGYLTGYSSAKKGEESERKEALLSYELQRLDEERKAKDDQLMDQYLEREKKKVNNLPNNMNQPIKPNNLPNNTKPNNTDIELYLPNSTQN